MRQYKRLIGTIALTGLAFSINYLIVMFLTPYITDHVGTEAYGFVTLAKNIAQYATIITVALNSFAVRFISVEYHHKNFRQANIYYSSVFYGDIFLGLIIFGIAGIGILFLDKLLQIPEAIVPDVKFMFLFVFIKFFLVTVTSAYNTGAYIKNKLNIISAFKLLSYVVETLVLLALFSALKPHVLYVGISLLAASIVEIYGNIRVTRKHTPELRTAKKDFEKKAVKDLIGNGIWTSVNSLGSFLHTGLDMIICNLMVGSFAMGQLAIANTIPSIFNSVISMISGPMQPLYLESYANNNKKKLLQQMDVGMKISSSFSNILFAGVVVLGLVYYKLWVPNQDIQTIFRITLIASFPRLSAGIMTPCFYGYTLTLKKKIPCFATLISGALNVISMIILIRGFHMGLDAVVWTTAVIITLLNVVIHPPLLAKYLEVPWYTFYPTIIRCYLACGLMYLVFRGLSLLYMPGSWLTFAATAVVYACIGLVIQVLITCTMEQKRSLMRKIKTKMRRKRGSV